MPVDGCIVPSSSGRSQVGIPNNGRRRKRLGVAVNPRTKGEENGFVKGREKLDC